MTSQEIQALINAKIAGQGSAVDVGGALPQILSGILELAQSGAQKTVIEIVGTLESGTLEQALACLTIDGEPATYEKMRSIQDPGSVLVKTRYATYAISYIGINENTVRMYGGYTIPNSDMQVIKIVLTTRIGGNSEVYFYEI